MKNLMVLVTIFLEWLISSIIKGFGIFQSLVKVFWVYMVLKQSWLRLLIIQLIVVFIGLQFNFIVALILLVLSIGYMAPQQEKYALEKGTWSNVYGNEHFIIPTVLSILFIPLISLIVYETSVPEYSKIQEIELKQHRELTSEDYMFLVKNGKDIKIMLSSSSSVTKCKNKTLIYYEERESSTINLSMYDGWFAECLHPMKKFQKID